jgi:steroid delta-isomerase-like uncharacterized protein
MSVEEKKAIALRYFQKVWAEGDYALEEEMLSPRYQDHNPAPGITTDRAGHHQFLVEFRTAFPDVQYIMEDVIAEGETVADRWTVHATHLGPFLGIAPTGRRISFSGIDILRIDADGKITDVWHMEDQLSVMQQLGIIPSLPGNSA